ncbi:MAG: EthD domain-containing protein [Anaerolineae bacterium]|nr:EthD domain-containing protein [Anaerolineae bacterium]
MSEQVKLIALLKATPGMSRTDFEERWVKGHAHLVARWKNIKGYRINVAIEEYQQEDEIPYDGTAELWWDSLEEMKADFASEDAKIAGEDADIFSVVRTHIITREYIIK